MKKKSNHVLEMQEIINSSNGKPEYMLFDASDYVENPVSLARIKAHLTQSELADLMGVKQAYISKIENQETVSPKIIEKMRVALSKMR